VLRIEIQRVDRPGLKFLSDLSRLKVFATTNKSEELIPTFGKPTLAANPTPQATYLLLQT
jgi:hypothetical protein